MEVGVMHISSGHTAMDAVHSEQHAEVIEGCLFVENKTTVSHKLTVSKLETAFVNHIAQKNGDCVVLSENVALYVNELCGDDGNFFLPDLMVVCDKKAIREDGVHAAPLFVAEVTSESTKKYDYNEKKEIYRKIGVGEYWIVDLQKKTVLKNLAEEDYVPQIYVRPETIGVSVYPGLEIDFSSLFSD